MTATILVVREFDNFSRILRESGFEVINCPAIETVESENSADLSAKLSAENYDGIFLTSRKATEIFAKRLFDKDFKFSGVIYVLGESSFKILADKNIRLYFDKTANTAREMMAAIPIDELKNKRFLFIRGEKSLGTIREILGEIATLDEAIVYETRRVEIEDSLKTDVMSKLRTGQIKFACFFSPSGAESFCEQFGAQSFHQTRIATIGKTTADFFEKRNLKVDFTPERATAEDFAIELINYLTLEKRKMENGK